VTESRLTLFVGFVMAKLVIGAVYTTREDEERLANMKHIFPMLELHHPASGLGNT
jgi:hypothetical protein